MPTPTQHREDIIARMHDVLRSTFGFDAFKGKQEEAVVATLTGRDCLVLMPTGGGKSLCYALPALLQPGLALVVSPLIALMQNQVEEFRAAGVAAAALSSATPAPERETLLADISGVPEPATKLLFVTPELLNTEGFQARLRGLGSRRRVSLLAVDEAHCISSWGHDFRPSYRRLAFARRCLPGVPVLALTATAAEKVQDDIVQQLGFGAGAVRLAASFDRPNIRYCVRYADTLPHEDRVADIVASFEAAQRRVPSRSSASAIVYTLKRDTADEVAAALTRKGMRCGAYHAGLRPAEREWVLGDWTGGRLPAVAATVAFGMGIDRGGVALVAHYNLPKTLEAFYQESGRAGRDGLPAQSVLYYGVEDRRRMDALLAKGDRRHARKRPQPGGGAAEQDAAAAARNFGEVVAYAMKATCRRRTVLAHFGEALPPGGCSGCDVCDDAAAVELQIARVEAKGLAAQTTRFGQRLDFSGGGGGSRKRRRGAGSSNNGGDGLTDYDAEGWAAGLSDKDDAGPNHGFGGARSSGDEDSDEERQAAVAAAVAQKAKARGGSATAALQRAEEAGAAKPTGTAARLLQRLEGGATAHPAAAALSAPAVDEPARQRSRAHLVKALAANGKLGLAPHQAAAAAQALEAEAFGGGGGSSSVYRSRVAAAARAIVAAATAPALPPAAAQAAASAAAAAEPSADAANGTAIAPQPMQPGRSTDPTSEARQPDVSPATAATTDGAQLLLAQFEALQGRLAAEDVEAALASLQRLGGAPVTASVLAETGLGRKLKPLTKHSDTAVAAAAANTIAAWKSAVLAQRQQ